MFRRSAIEMRVLVLAPTGRDAKLLSATLTRGGIDNTIVAEMKGLLEALREGAGAVLIGEEAIGIDDVEAIKAWLVSQEAWSDMSFTVLNAGRNLRQRQPTPAQQLTGFGNFAQL